MTSAKQSSPTEHSAFIPPGHSAPHVEVASAHVTPHLLAPPGHCMHVQHIVLGQHIVLRLAHHVEVTTECAF